MDKRTDREHDRMLRKQEHLLLRDDRCRLHNDEDALDRFFLATLYRKEKDGGKVFCCRTFHEVKSLARREVERDQDAWWMVEWYLNDLPWGERIAYIKLDHRGNLTTVYTNDTCVKLGFWDRRRLLVKHARKRTSPEGDGEFLPHRK